MMVVNTIIVSFKRELLAITGISAIALFRIKVEISAKNVNDQSVEYDQILYLRNFTNCFFLVSLSGLLVIFDNDLLYIIAANLFLFGLYFGFLGFMCVIKYIKRMV